MKKLPTVTAWRLVSAHHLLIAVVLASCGAEELTRTKALALLIEARPRLAEPSSELALTSEAWKEGATLGLWDRQGNVADDASSLLAGASPEGTSITLTKPYRIRVEITGITDAPMMEGKMKEIEFSWSYDDLTPTGEYFASNGGSGSAVARLYDDGWRLEDRTFPFRIASERFPVADDTRAHIRNVAATAQERRRRQEEEAAEAEKMRQAEAAQRRAERIAQSQLATRVLGEFHETSKNVPLAVTNVSIRGMKVSTTPCKGDIGVYSPCITGVATDEAWLCNSGGKMASVVSHRTRHFAQTYIQHQKVLEFGAAEERDRFVAAVNEASQAWYNEYSDIVSRRICPN